MEDSKETPFDVLLAPGDLRTVGRSAEAAAILLRQPHRVGELLDAIERGAPAVRMRAADALQKAAVERPALLASHAERLLALAERASQKEVRWHAAQMLPGLKLSPAQADRAVRLLTRWLGDPASAIVRAESLDALSRLASAEPARIASVRAVIEAAMEHGTPAVIARGKKALKRLARADFSADGG